MKKYLFALFLIFACLGVYAQSVSFGDLLNLTSMNDGQSHDLLASSKGFKASGAQTLNGRAYAEYKSAKGESVLVGAGIKSTSGNVTHEIIYNTNLEADINNMLAQAKKSTLTLVFQGADLAANIYRFDNSLFRASISLAFDKKSGNVDVQQK